MTLRSNAPVPLVRQQAGGIILTTVYAVTAPSPLNGRWRASGREVSGVVALVQRTLAPSVAGPGPWARSARFRCRSADGAVSPRLGRRDANSDDVRGMAVEGLASLVLAHRRA